MRFSVICLVLSAALSAAVHPQTAPGQAGSATALMPAAMTNADVVAMVQAGLPDEVVIAKIQAAPSTAFDTGVNALTALKAASVSPAVVRTMIQPRPAPTVYAGLAGRVPAGDPDDPASPHNPGIYVLTTGADGHRHMIRLQAEHPRGAKSSGVFLHAVTHGITSAKTQDVLDGAKAQVELDVSRPVFYAYVPDESASFTGGMNVSQIELTRLTVSGDTRLYNIANHGLFRSNEIGNDQKARQGFTAEQVSPGTYKLTLAGELNNGQYAFKMAFGFFDFGVEAKS